MAHITLLLSTSLLVLSTSSLAMDQSQARVRVPCDSVTQNLTPCVGYLFGQESAPSTECCRGAKYVLMSFGRSKGGRQGVCTCLVAEIPYLGSPVSGARIQLLPGKCGIKIKLPPITDHFDCSKVN